MFKYTLVLILVMDESVIRKWVLHNAVKYEGKASAGSVVGHLIGENPEVKSKLKELMPVIQKTVMEVNKLKIEKQVEELKKLAPELLEEKPKEQEAQEEQKETDTNGRWLPNVTKNRLRFQANLWR